MAADEACEVIDAVVAQGASAADFVGRSALPAKTQREFRRILETRAASLRDERP
ncbi:hypothetical protein [Nannocystis punicea]|uniref:Uncharacterized protein n=1 Tax=Nannocystis punicea TaxID=2995304 RepID=A0ABY7HIS7_9BACT|nr:hypothetical protein [Nannocystis poenicansa]WAS99222.1 hypothetical protein O0S08_24095 [Nannocystis poenicansa]